MAEYVELFVSDDEGRVPVWKQRIPDRIAESDRKVWDEAFLYGFCAGRQFENDGRVFQVHEV